MQKEQFLQLLPDMYAVQLMGMDWMQLEELRMGTGRPLIVRSAGREQSFWPKAESVHMEDFLRRACKQSVYACADTLRQGYLTLSGGHRVGICGTGVMQHGSLYALRDPTSMVLRIAHEVQGCADSLMKELSGSTLLLGPPGSGKTTLLRDCVRQLSDRKRQWVALADERGELSAMADGRAQLNIGSRTDVMLQVEKAEAVMMLLRTMSPQWIAMDEITAPADVEALERAANCGVFLLATAHGDSLQDMHRRPLYRRLLQTGVFEKIVLLNADKSYTIEEGYP